MPAGERIITTLLPGGTGLPDSNAFRKRGTSREAVASEPTWINSLLFIIMTDDLKLSGQHNWYSGVLMIWMVAVLI